MRTGMAKQFNTHALPLSAVLMAVHFTPVRFIALTEFRCDPDVDNVLVQLAAATVTGCRLMRQTVH